METVAPYDLAKRRALVTGAGKRVGAAIAERLGSLGAHVAVHYHRSEAGARRTCGAITEAGGQATLVQADLRERGSCQQLVDDVVAQLGGLDVLVLSAANFERVPLDAVTPANWQEAMCLNLEAPLWIAQRAAPALRRSCGSITFVTCHSTIRPFRAYVPYVVSKAGLKQLMHALALELAPDVRVNAVAPGAVLPPEDMDEDGRQQLVQQIPLAKLGRPEDIADAVSYLASSPFVTGQQLLVDGGQSLR